MRTLRRCIAVVAAVWAMATVTGLTQESAAKPLTNADVIRMVKAGLSESVIVLAIDQAPKKAFDHSVDALIALKQAGVSETVIKAMMGTVPPVVPASVGGSTIASTSSPLSEHAPGIYLNASATTDKLELVAMQATTITQTKSKGGLASAFTGGLAKSSLIAVVGGGQAHLRTTQHQPVFYFYFDTKAGSFGGAFGAWMAAASSPDEFVLVEMTPDNKSGERDLEVGQFRAYSHNMGVQSKDRVDFKTESLAPGIFRVTTVQRLSPGEFCFFYAQGAGTLAGGIGKLFDFGVD